MAKKSKRALYAGLAGIGQGAAQYGGWLAGDALARMGEDREFDRQKSLMEIRQRYQTQTQIDMADPNSALGGALERQRIRFAKEQLGDPSTELGPLMEDYRIKLAKEQYDPTTEVGAVMEAHRGRENQRAIDLREAYGYGSSAGIIGNLSPGLYTPESWNKFMVVLNDEIAAQQTRGEKEDVEAAARKAFTIAPLVEKKEVPAGVQGDITSSINDALGIFMQGGKAQMVMTLMDLELGGEELQDKSVNELVEIYRQFLTKNFGGALLDQSGLGPVGPGAMPGAQGDTLGIGLPGQ